MIFMLGFLNPHRIRRSSWTHKATVHPPSSNGITRRAHPSALRRPSADTRRDHRILFWPDADIPRGTVGTGLASKVQNASEVSGNDHPQKVIDGRRVPLTVHPTIEGDPP
jgi:hypothetical protein